MPENKGITLYTAGTPNGWKASILIEELGIKCKVHPISLSKNQQKEEWFLKINPNGRIPAIGMSNEADMVACMFFNSSMMTAMDHDEGDLPIFESGAIMLHLAEKEGKLLPKDVRKRAEVISWLMFQMASAPASC